jgi:hypothetical protein
MTPNSASYLPGTPGGQPMTPGTGGLDIMSPVLGKFLYFVKPTDLVCTKLFLQLFLVRSSHHNCDGPSYCHL